MNSFIAIRHYLTENNFDFVSYYDTLQGYYEIAIRTDKNNLKILLFKNLYFSRSYISICDYDNFLGVIARNIISVGQFTDVFINRGGKSSPEK